ncbi:hypothetical protein Nocox_32740 [Nonomuraea coxensis DSM 45129]|uniref:Pycsar effector protein domain-containing protein n=1 Tax=Nonomuraea coxensis DSM 45129 TaxID=1122611 RepID=A0ABX8U8Q1_9ACTN|nr:Pycsar system effector family protein [Nonomuraea coxensis]QYC44119.1 hypothetical protein Nocox_32740 [Nonomuraea coxensis DSM 45129]
MLRRIARALDPAGQERSTSAHEDIRAYARQMLAETREELNRADAKAQVLLGIVGVGLGAVTGGLLAGSWSPFRLSDSVEWLWWAGVASAVASVLVLARAVYPRLDRRRRRDDAVMYYADVLRFDSAAELSRALAGSSAMGLERLADQLHRVSAIVGQKYRLIRWGFWLLLAGLAGTVGAVLVDLALTPAPP